jgi:hypothetical protein
LPITIRMSKSARVLSKPVRPTYVGILPEEKKGAKPEHLVPCPPPASLSFKPQPAGAKPRKRDAKIRENLAKLPSKPSDPLPELLKQAPVRLPLDDKAKARLELLLTFSISQDNKQNGKALLQALQCFGAVCLKGSFVTYVLAGSLYRDIDCQVEVSKPLAIGSLERFFADFPGLNVRLVEIDGVGFVAHCRVRGSEGTGMNLWDIVFKTVPTAAPFEEISNNTVLPLAFPLDPDALELVCSVPPQVKDFFKKHKVLYFHPDAKSGILRVGKHLCHAEDSRYRIQPFLFEQLLQPEQASKQDVERTLYYLLHSFLIAPSTKIIIAVLGLRVTTLLPALSKIALSWIEAGMSARDVRAAVEFVVGERATPPETLLPAKQEAVAEAVNRFCLSRWRFAVSEKRNELCLIAAQQLAAQEKSAVLTHFTDLLPLLPFEKLVELWCVIEEADNLSFENQSFLKRLLVPYTAALPERGSRQGPGAYYLTALVAREESNDGAWGECAYRMLSDSKEILRDPMQALVRGLSDKAKSHFVEALCRDLRHNKSFAFQHEDLLTTLSFDKTLLKHLVTTLVPSVVARAENLELTSAECRLFCHWLGQIDSQEVPASSLKALRSLVNFALQAPECSEVVAALLARQGELDLAKMLAASLVACDADPWLHACTLLRVCRDDSKPTPQILLAAAEKLATTLTVADDKRWIEVMRCYWLASAGFPEAAVKMVDAFGRAAASMSPEAIEGFGMAAVRLAQQHPNKNALMLAIAPILCQAGRVPRNQQVQQWLYLAVINIVDPEMRWKLILPLCVAAPFYAAAVQTVNLVAEVPIDAASVNSLLQSYRREPSEELAFLMASLVTSPRQSSEITDPLFAIFSEHNFSVRLQTEVQIENWVAILSTAAKNELITRMPGAFRVVQRAVRCAELFDTKKRWLLTLNFLAKSSNAYFDDMIDIVSGCSELRPQEFALRQRRLQIQIETFFSEHAPAQAQRVSTLLHDLLALIEIPQRGRAKWLDARGLLKVMSSSDYEIWGSACKLLAVICFSYTDAQDGIQPFNLLFMKSLLVTETLKLRIERQAVLSAAISNYVLTAAHDKSWEVLAKWRLAYNDDYPSNKLPKPFVRLMALGAAQLQRSGHQVPDDHKSLRVKIEAMTSGVDLQEWRLRMRSRTLSDEKSKELLYFQAASLECIKDELMLLCKQHCDVGVQKLLEQTIAQLQSTSLSALLETHEDGRRTRAKK